MIIRGRAFINRRIEDDVTIRFDDGRIRDVSVGDGRSACEQLILPGFIDVHVHGGDGADFMDGSIDAVRTVTRHHARHGTTCLGATTLSASSSAILEAIRAVVESSARAPDDASEIAAVHFEGPYLNAARAGAQDRGSIRPANREEIEAWIEAAGTTPLMMTAAPECEGVLAAIDRFGSRILFSIGHTQADFALCRDAIARGARHFTHLFNAMPPFHHRDPGPVGAAIEAASATVEIIADGAHVHPIMLAAIARLLPDRLALVTDAMRACGRGDGTWRLHDYEVTVHHGVATLADGTLAGSLLTMDAAVRNMVNLAGVDLAVVIPLATETPARILGVADRKGRIARGYDADLVVMDSELDVERVFLRGVEIAS